MMRGRRFLSAFYVVKTRTNAVRAMSRVPPKVTLDHVLALLKDLKADVGAFKTDVGSKMDVVLKRVGVVHESTVRSVLVRMFGEGYSEQRLTRNVYGLVRACTQPGCILPGERSMPSANLSLMRGSVELLEHTRVLRLIRMLNVRTHGCRARCLCDALSLVAPQSLRQRLEDACKELKKLIAMKSHAQKNTTNLTGLLQLIEQDLRDWDAARCISPAAADTFLQFHDRLPVALLTAATSDFVVCASQKRVRITTGCVLLHSSSSGVYNQSPPYLQAPFQCEIQVDVCGHIVQTPLVDGTEILLSIVAGEIKSNSDGEQAVRQLARWFAVLERVVIAISASDSARWCDGIANESHASRSARGVVAYSFLGRVHTDGPLDMGSMDKWALPSSTGVTFKRPSCVHFVSMPM